MRLSALAVQRHRFGAPLRYNAFDILVFANNCSDDTVAVETRAIGKATTKAVLSVNYAIDSFVQRRWRSKSLAQPLHPAFLG